MSRAADIQTMSPSQYSKRASLACSLSGTVLQLTRRAVQLRNPTVSAEELDVAFVEVCYGSALARKLKRDLEQRKDSS